MSLFRKIILLVVVGVFTTAGICFSTDIDIGVIIELSHNRKFIQVKDRIYKINKVERLAVKNEPVAGDISDLEEGNIVQVVKGKKEDSYWYADKVTLYQGELAETMWKDMELPGQHRKKSNSQQQATGSADSTNLVIKNGVWHN